MLTNLLASCVTALSCPFLKSIFYHYIWFWEYSLLDFGHSLMNLIWKPCLLAGKFEEKEDKVPKLEYLNNLAYMYNMNVVLNKKDLLRMEMLLLENFNWNLCLPTPAHYIDYYLYVSIGENDLHNGWPITSLTKIKDFLQKYAYYFLDFSVQGKSLSLCSNDLSFGKRRKSERRAGFKTCHYVDCTKLPVQNGFSLQLFQVGNAMRLFLVHKPLVSFQKSLVEIFFFLFSLEC